MFGCENIWSLERSDPKRFVCLGVRIYGPYYIFSIISIIIKHSPGLVVTVVEIALAHDLLKVVITNITVGVAVGLVEQIL